MNRRLKNRFATYLVMFAVLIAVSLVFLACNSEKAASNDEVSYKSDKTDEFSQDITSSYSFIDSVLVYYDADTLTVQCSVKDGTEQIDDEDIAAIRQKTDELLLDNNEFRDEFLAARKDRFFKDTDSMKEPSINFYISGLDAQNTTESDGNVVPDPVTFYRAEKSSWDKLWEEISTN